MTAKYEHIATITLDSSASSVTFSSIPQGYRDLELIVDGSGDSNANFGARFNNDTGSNYSFVAMYGNGSSGIADTNTINYIPLVYASANGVSQGFAQIMDYSAVDKHTTSLLRQNNVNDVVRAMTVRWSNTAAITEIDIFRSAGNINSGTTFDLYGIVGGA